MQHRGGFAMSSNFEDAAPLPDVDEGFQSTTEITNAVDQLPEEELLEALIALVPDDTVMADLLDQLRSERDTDNAAAIAAALETARQYVVGIVATQQTAEAQQVPPAVQAAALVRKVAEGTLRFLGPGRVTVRQSELGTVLSKDPTTKTCTVRLQTDAIVPPAAPLRVSYGSGNPVVGKSYPVHVPYILSRDPNAERGWVPDPSHLPWLIAPGLKRWLYGKSRSNLYRWTWPPPTDLSVDWDPEIVTTGLDGSWRLLGASTPPDEATQIVFEKVNSVGAEGDPQVQAASSTLHHLDAMGFGDEIHSYTLQPSFANTGTSIGSGAIANDGVAVAALNIRGQAFPVPDAHVVQRIDYVPDLPQQSCCITIGVFLSCIFIDNFKPEFIYADVPQPPVHREMGQGLWLGDPVPAQGSANFGLLRRVGSLFESGGLWEEIQHTNATKKTCHGAGCHIIVGFIITWDTYSCEYSIVNSDGISFWFFQYTSSLHYDYGAFGAWEYDGTPAGGWAWTELASPHPHMQSRFDTTLEEQNTLALKVQGVGCTPSGPTTLAIGRANNVLAMGLDPETRELIVWFRTLVLHQDSGPDVTFHRWQNGSDSIFVASQFYCTSRDGADALIERSPRSWAFTLDSATSWTNCRAPDKAGTLNIGVFKLIDELG